MILCFVPFSQLAAVNPICLCNQTETWYFLMVLVDFIGHQIHTAILVPICSCNLMEIWLSGKQLLDFFLPQ